MNKVTRAVSAARTKIESAISSVMERMHRIKNAVLGKDSMAGLTGQGLDQAKFDREVQHDKKSKSSIFERFRSSSKQEVDDVLKMDDSPVELFTQSDEPAELSRSAMLDQAEDLQAN